MILKVELKNKDLGDKILRLEGSAEDIRKSRIPKKPSELSTKLQLKNMILDVEKEIGMFYTCLLNGKIIQNKNKILF